MIWQIKKKRGLRWLFYGYALCDVVVDPVADNDTMETVQLYISGILNADEAVGRLRYSQVNNQVPFHTKNALESIKFVGRDCYE